MPREDDGLTYQDMEIIEKFKNDVAKFSGNYTHFLVIAETETGHFMWRSNNGLWGYGAAQRYVDETRNDFLKSQSIGGKNAE